MPYLPKCFGALLSLGVCLINDTEDDECNTLSFCKSYLSYSIAISREAVIYSRET